MMRSSGSRRRGRATDQHTDAWGPSSLCGMRVVDTGFHMKVERDICSR